MRKGSYEVILVPTAQGQLGAMKAFDNRRDLEAIEASLTHEPLNKGAKSKGS